MRIKIPIEQLCGGAPVVVLRDSFGPLSFRTKMRFVIIGQPRTGSTHLVTRLNGHPDILCNGEIFNTQAIYLRWPDDAISPSVRSQLQKKRRTDPHGFMDGMFETTFGRRHVGFKIFGAHNPSILRRLLDAEDVRKIVLYRSNVLANYSSMKIARASKTWKLKPGESPPAGVAERVEFDPAEFVRFHNRYVRFYAGIIERLTETAQPFFLIRYDELNDDHIFASLVQFIGASDAGVYSRTAERKQNASDIISRFSDQCAVADFLAERKLLHWRNEGELSLLPLPEDAPADAEQLAPSS